MQVSVHLVGGLHKYIAGASEWTPMELEEGDTVRRALERMGVQPQLVSTVLLDGERSTLDTTLQEGQEVTVIALMGGGC